VAPHDPNLLPPTMPSKTAVPQIVEIYASEHGSIIVYFCGRGQIHCQLQWTRRSGKSVADRVVRGLFRALGEYRLVVVGIRVVGP